jgi:hypothetical protein
VCLGNYKLSITMISDIITIIYIITILIIHISIADFMNFNLPEIQR